MPVKLQTRSTGEDGDEARIEVVPLIDIMFFLLASFMMVSLSMTQLNRVPVNVPEAETGISDSQTPPHHITVDREGFVTWDGEVVTSSEITARLRKESSPENVQVMISADAESRHKNVLGVLDAIRAAGVEKVSFESKRPEP